LTIALNSATKKLRTLCSGVFSVLGVVIAILSLSSLAQRWGQWSLASLTSEILQYYRTLADQAGWLLFDWWLAKIWPEFSFPAWGIDCLFVWILLGAAVWRGERSKAAIYIERLEEIRSSGRYEAEVDRLYADFPRILRERYGIWFFITPVAFMKYLNRLRIDFGDVLTYWEMERRLHRPSFDPLARSLIFASSPVIGTVAFFCWNAFML